MPDRHLQAVQISQKETDLESEWRKGVIGALDGLREGQAEMAGRFSAMAKENAEQHGTLEAEVAGLKTAVRGMDKRIDEILKKGLDDASEKLAGKSRLIRVLSIVMVFLLGIIGGVKLHAMGWLKDIFPL